MPITGVNLANIVGRPINLIDPDPDNSRDMESAVTQADIEEIALSILKRGFDPDRAILVRSRPGGRYMVTDGNKRRAAFIRARELGAAIELMPTRSEEKGTDEQDRALLRLRAPGRELSPLEAAIDIKRLIGWQWSTDDIAEKLGKQPDWVRRCLDLAGASTEVRDAVRNGHIAPTEAVKAIRQHKENAGPIITAAREVAQERGKNRATARDIEKVTKPRTEAPSLCSLATAAVLAWESSGDSATLSVAMQALRDHLGAATLDAARERVRETA